MYRSYFYGPLLNTNRRHPLVKIYIIFDSNLHRNSSASSQSQDDQALSMPSSPWRLQPASEGAAPSSFRWLWPRSTQILVLLSTRGRTNPHLANPGNQNLMLKPSWSGAVCEEGGGSRNGVGGCSLSHLNCFCFLPLRRGRALDVASFRQLFPPEAFIM